MSVKRDDRIKAFLHVQQLIERRVEAIRARPDRTCPARKLLCAWVAYDARYRHQLRVELGL